jgi:hypothetical protein
LLCASAYPYFNSPFHHGIPFHIEAIHHYYEDVTETESRRSRHCGGKEAKAKFVGHRKFIFPSGDIDRKSRSITSFFKAPGTSSNGFKPDSPLTKFDKKAWIAKLTDEQKQLLKLEIDTMHESWLGSLKDELTKPEFLELKRFLKREAESGKTIFPPSADVYSWCVHPTNPLNSSALLAATDGYFAGLAILHLIK